jgi:putative sigma-54 modulation protein
MAFNLDIQTKNLELTERMRDYTAKKVAKLDRFLDNIDDARVELRYEKTARDVNQRYVAQITLYGNGGSYMLRSEERGASIFAAIDAMEDAIQRQTARYKGKRQDMRLRPASRALPEEALALIEEEEAEGEEEAGPRIVRHKRFVLEPMDENEAVEQMALLGHDNFFVFYNVNTSSINVLYKRTDGTFGVIEPLVA